MDRIKDLIARVKYNVRSFKLAPYALMYKDEAEASRAIIANLQAQNRILKEQSQVLAEQISTQNAHINSLLGIMAK